jgi:hypothetical protein
MTKQENIDNPNSCWNKAAPDAVVFVLKDTDPSFAATVKFWAGERVRLGCNGWTDDKIRGAIQTADEVAQTQGERYPCDSARL